MITMSDLRKMSRPMSVGRKAISVADLTFNDVASKRDGDTYTTDSLSYEFWTDHRKFILNKLQTIDMIKRIHRRWDILVYDNMFKSQIIHMFGGLDIPKLMFIDDYLIWEEIERL